MEIDATEAQKARLDPIVKQAAKDLLPLRGRMRDARERAVGLLTADSIDRTAIEALRAEQLAAAEQGSRRIAQAVADIAEVLTPEQRKTIAQRLERRRGWHRGAAFCLDRQACGAIRRRLQCIWGCDATLVLRPTNAA